MATEVKNDGKKLVITMDINERVSASGKTVLIASDTVKAAYKDQVLTVAANAYFKNPQYVKPTHAEKVAATKAEIAKLEAAIA